MCELKLEQTFVTNENKVYPETKTVPDQPYEYDLPGLAQTLYIMINQCQ